MKKIKHMFGKLYFFEKMAILYIAFSLIFMKCLGLRFVSLENYFYYEIFVTLMIGYMMLLLYMGWRIAKAVLAGGDAAGFSGRVRSSSAGTLRFMRENYFNGPFIADSMRIIVTVVLILVFFCNLKQVIPIANPALFDARMWEMDKMLHFGVSPTLVSLKLLGSKTIMRGLDYIYVTFFAMNIIVPLIFILQTASKPLRNRFFNAFCLLWVVGGLSYFIFPALGPCYYKAELFTALDAPLAKRLQELLLCNYNIFRSNPHTYVSSNFYGIAAMPSLHLGQIALFAIFTRRLNRFLSTGLWVYMALMFAGSILLGWHYAIDDYAGILLAVVIYLVVVKWPGSFS